MYTNIDFSLWDGPSGPESMSPDTAPDTSELLSKLLTETIYRMTTTMFTQTRSFRTPEGKYLRAAVENVREGGKVFRLDCRPDAILVCSGEFTEEQLYPRNVVGCILTLLTDKGYTQEFLSNHVPYEIRERVAAYGYNFEYGHFNGFYARLAHAWHFPCTPFFVSRRDFDAAPSHGVLVFPNEEAVALMTEKTLVASVVQLQEASYHERLVAEMASRFPDANPCHVSLVAHDFRISCSEASRRLVDAGGDVHAVYRDRKRPATTTPGDKVAKNPRTT
jgi:hypothetical protein